MLAAFSFPKPASQNTVSHLLKRETLSSVSVSDLSSNSTFSNFLLSTLFKFEDGGNSSLYQVFSITGKVSLPVTLAINLIFSDSVSWYIFP